MWTLRLRFDALRRAEILQQRHTILAAEVHEFDVLDAIVEEDTLAVGIYATVGALQVIVDGAWHNARAVRNANTFYNARGEFHQRGWLHRDILYEAHHQRIVTQAQL